MIRLPESLRAWGTPEFAAVLKREIGQQAAHLPLQQGLRHSSSVGDEPVTVVVHSLSETAESLRVKVGVFYQGLVTGCSCANDPSPPGENSEYCELLLEMDKNDATTAVVLLEE